MCSKAEAANEAVLQEGYAAEAGAGKREKVLKGDIPGAVMVLNIALKRPGVSFIT